MGLLDDAIREHLELKRRHGADPDEVARQEREALGAPRRGEFAQTEPAGDAHVADSPLAGEPLAPADPEEAPGEEDAAVAAPPDPAAEEPAPPAPPEPEPEAVAAVAAGREEEPWLADEDEPDEVPAEETLEHPAPAPGEGEDVLEETPEFLQETPEHDRLWFEQK